jgi:hypothetical protein
VPRSADRVQGEAVSGLTLDAWPAPRRGPPESTKPWAVPRGRGAGRDPLTLPQVLPNALVFGEWLLASLQQLELSPHESFTVYLTLFTFVRGAAMNTKLEADAEAASGQSSDQWMAHTEPALLGPLGTRSFPAFEEGDR